VEDILASHRVRRSLIAHRKKHPEPMTARENAEAMGVTVEMAADHRRKMEAAGLLRVEEGYENKVPFVRTYLTPEGVHAADCEIQADEWARKARERKEREKKR
jgi:DNA-binding MarR family transcriptional regulator